MKNQKGFAHIILILVVVIIAFGGAYYFGTFKNKPSLSLVVPTSTTIINNSPIPSPIEAVEEKGIANWKTYITKDSKFSFKYPSDWVIQDDSKNVDLYNDGKFQLQKNISISKGDYKFMSADPLAWGPGGCLYPDSPKFEGPAGMFDQYTEIKGLVNVYRRSKTDLPPEIKAANQKWTICSKEKVSEYFVTVAWFGWVSYETPLNYDESYLKVMDKILASLQVVK